MKYKDWKKWNEKFKPDQIKGNAIYCPDCGKFICYDKDLMFRVITEPIVCPDCDEIIIMPSTITLTCSM